MTDSSLTLMVEILNTINDGLQNNRYDAKEGIIYFRLPAKASNTIIGQAFTRRYKNRVWDIIDYVFKHNPGATLIEIELNGEKHLIGMQL